VENLPIHLVVSAGVYNEVTRRRREAKRTLLEAFGDPDYMGGTPAETGTVENGEGNRRRAFDTEPLPATRLEVEAIASLYPERVRMWLGREATEERAKDLDPGATMVHFACHAFLDERFPLDSSLVMTPPVDDTATENGLLQAWEVFERIRIDADLVTLSSCDTGLGKEMAGEGLIGMTRAFQYAGARSVLASLWRVPDWTTADFMRRFYTYLKEGDTKDAALRRAQEDFLSGPIRITAEGGEEIEADASHPYYWAGFVLHGDWR
jgi:CHAT domain-containing protein